MGSEVRFSLLGPVEVTEGGSPVDVGGRQARLVLALLLATPGRLVSADALVDALWGDEPPASAMGTLQSYVSRLRARLGADTVRREGAGYRLVIDPAAVEHVAFERLADEGREQLHAGSPDVARDLLVEAEALWRGRALGDLADVEALRGLAARLDDRRLAALEDRVDADLALGRHAPLAGELGALVAEHPLRERLRAAHALALYRSGRQAEALRALAEATTTLREELGIEPSKELRDLEAAILAQDPGLAAPAARPSSSAGPPTGSSAGATASAASEVAPFAVGTVGVATPLVGREVEWAEVVAAWAESAADGRIVVVEGEPGIGKTRLGEELRAHAAAAGAVAVWGRADEGGAAPALWPWLPPLRALRDVAPTVPEPVSALLAGGAASGAALKQAAQFELFEAVADLLGTVAAVRPVVVLVDDLQWADGASLDLLGFLAERMPAGVTVLVTVRRLEVGRRDAVTEALARVARRPGSRRLRLGGLAAESTAAILAAVAGRELAPALASAIHVRAEGNPFYAIELVRLRDEEGDLAGEVPASVGDVVRRRLDRLPEATLDALRAAAVVGRDVRVDLLARALGVDLDAALDVIDPAVAHRLLVEDPDRAGALRFSHALVREVLVEDMTSLRRARLHLRVADALEALGAGVDEAEIVADHLWRAAAVGVGRRAADALERAAEVALKRVSYSTAEELLSKAAALRRSTGSGPDDERAELDTIMRLLEVARAQRYFEAVRTVDEFGRAQELADRLGLRATVIDLLWFAFTARASSAQIPEAGELVAQALALTADDPDPLVRASGLTMAGVQAWSEGRIADGVEVLDEAVALYAEGGEVTDSFALERKVLTDCFRLFCHAAHGARPVADVLADFIALAESIPDPFVAGSVYGFGATTAVVVAGPDEAGHLSALGREADPEGQFEFWAAHIAMHEPISRARRGEVDVAAFRRGMDDYTRVGGRSGMAALIALMALELVAVGELDASAALLEDAREEEHTFGEGWPKPVIRWAEATLARARGADPDEVAAAFARAVDLAEAQGAHRVADRIRSSAAG